VSQLEVYQAKMNYQSFRDDFVSSYQRDDPYASAYPIFQEYTSVEIISAICHSLNKYRSCAILEEVITFYDNLIPAFEAAKSGRSGFDRAGDGDSMSEVDEWSYQLWIHESVIFNASLYWPQQAEYDDEIADWGVFFPVDEILEILFSFLTSTSSLKYPNSLP
jgi:hypothetical protein